MDWAAVYVLEGTAKELRGWMGEGTGWVQDVNANHSWDSGLLVVHGDELPFQVWLKVVLGGFFGKSAQSRKRVCLYLDIDSSGREKNWRDVGLWSKGMSLSLDPCHGSQMLLWACRMHHTGALGNFPLFKGEVGIVLILWPLYARHCGSCVYFEKITIAPVHLF